jgi:enterochelin esterase-like enzyme
MGTSRRRRRALVIVTILFIFMLVPAGRVAAQERAAAAPAGRAGAQAGPTVVSPEVQPDRRVVFRLLAPQAEGVMLRGSDIPALASGGRGGPAGQQMTKGENGVWETTVGPLDPGAYRYTFVVSGVAVIDPRNPATSESNNNTWSLVVVPGSDLMDAKMAPHGAVSSVYYYSTALKRTRRLHVYTPPGYEAGREKYPVFYLLHGAGDCDDSWTSVGRAGFILDNLIAAKRAKPMIVVMPAGHTTSGASGARPAAAPAAPATPTAPAAAASAPAAPPRDEFLEDFVTDIMPLVEKRYRVLTGRGDRAIAGLSMGGGQTLNISFSRLDKFAYIGVFSSGIMGGGAGRGAATPAAGGAPGVTPAAAWEQRNLAALDKASLKKGLKLVWFSTGVDDGLITNSKNTVEMLQKHGFNPVFKESRGGHTWLNWRDYLVEFAPQLFR